MIADHKNDSKGKRGLVPFRSFGFRIADFRFRDREEDDSTYPIDTVPGQHRKQSEHDYHNAGAPLKMLLPSVLLMLR